jgi:hypothetical protein
VANIIVAAPPVHGELTPLLQLGRGLAARGHRITVLTGSRFRVTVENAGLGFAPLHGTADYDIGQLMALPERDGLQPRPALLNSDWIHAFVNPKPDQHATDLLLKDTDVRENVRKLAEVYASHDAVTEIERLVLTPS